METSARRDGLRILKEDPNVASVSKTPVPVSLNKCGPNPGMVGVRRMGLLGQVVLSEWSIFIVFSSGGFKKALGPASAELPNSNSDTYLGRFGSDFGCPSVAVTLTFGCNSDFCTVTLTFGPRPE